MENPGYKQWFKDAKFGLFIHFGLYSLLAGEFEGQKTRSIAEWIMHDLKIPKEKYVKLAAQFNPTALNPDKIAKMAKDAGMKYLCLTSKHHDGFALFDSAADPYNVVKASPYQRDICRDFQEACLKHGLKLCFYYSQAQDWHHEGGLARGIDANTPLFERYLEEKCIPQIKEILTNYGPVGMIWFDTPVSMTKAQSERLKEVVKSIQPDCLISGRIGNGLGDYMTTGDNFIPLLPFDGCFEVPATMNHTWGFNKDDHDWKDARRILTDMVHIVSRGGNYLLNIGPDGEGRVPEASVQVLKEISQFFEKNAESIHDTKPVPVYPYDLPWLGMTTKPYTLYLHLFEKRQRVYLINIKNKLKKATLLQDGRELPFVQGATLEGDGYFIITLPEDIADSPDTVIKCELVEEEVAFEPLKI